SGDIKAQRLSRDAGRWTGEARLGSVERQCGCQDLGIGLGRLVERLVEAGAHGDAGAGRVWRIGAVRGVNVRIITGHAVYQGNGTVSYQELAYQVWAIGIMPEADAGKIARVNPARGHRSGPATRASPIRAATTPRPTGDVGLVVFGRAGVIGILIRA